MKWNNIFQVLEEKNYTFLYYTIQILYSVKITFRNEGEIKTFSDKGKLGGLSTANLL